MCSRPSTFQTSPRAPENYSLLTAVSVFTLFLCQESTFLSISLLCSYSKTHVRCCLLPFHNCTPLGSQLTSVVPQHICSHLHLFIITFHHHLVRTCHFASFGDVMVNKIAWSWPSGFYCPAFIAFYCNSLFRSIALTGQLSF